ncbi:MAG: sigma-70 family RNA polymerase sigma factor [bacterium]|nr:sigma-70 family RNA polymerase sigma factor [bacterium]
MPRAIEEPDTDPAFAAFLARHRGRVLGFLRRLAPRDADDLLQETFAKVWRYRSGWDPQRASASWLLRTAFHVTVDHRRRAGRQPQPDDERARSQTAAAPCRSELRDEIERSLASLSAVERALLLGFHRDERSLQQLATEHDLPVNTVKSHLHRARRKLQREPSDD